MIQFRPTKSKSRPAVLFLLFSFFSLGCSFCAWKHGGLLITRWKGATREERQRGCVTGELTADTPNMDFKFLFSFISGRCTRCASVCARAHM